jgi:hypothetical protein
MTYKDKQKQWVQMEELVKNTMHTNEHDPLFQTFVALRIHGIYPRGGNNGFAESPTAAPWINIQSGKKELSDTTYEKLHELYIRLGLDKVKTRAEYEATIKQRTTYDNAVDKIRFPIIRAAEKLSYLLDEFYKDRKVHYSARLTLRFAAGYYIRLESQGILFQEVQSQELKERRLEVFRQEMKEFTDFLKKKYFEE